MRVREITYILELPETLEEGSAKIVCDKPYKIERQDKNGQVIWFGYNTNWIKKDGQWYVLVGSEFAPCDIPEYEKMFLKTVNVL